MRMLYWPFRFPDSFSSRYPGSERSSRLEVEFKFQSLIDHADQVRLEFATPAGDLPFPKIDGGDLLVGKPCCSAHCCKY